MKRIFTLFLFVFLSLQGLKLNAQIDTCFWFAAPWVTPDHWWRDNIKLHISTFNAPSTTVRLRQPGAIAPNKYDTTIIIPANSTFDYIFWRDKLATTTNVGFDSLETRPADVVVPYGLYISSSANISVVYNVLTRAANFSNPETFSLKGQNALGTHFLCPFQTKHNNNTVVNLAGTPAGIIQPKSQINIVASKANTTVSITPKCAIVGHAANITYTVFLNNPGDAYTIENAVQTTSVLADNLSGTEISSNKPITVTVADDSMKGVSGCSDLTGDQIVPTNVIGSEYVIIKGFLQASENEGAYILATQNNTTLNIDNGVVNTTTVINNGATYFYKVTEPLTRVSSNNPVYCLQLTGFGCEYGSDILAPLNCSGSNVVSFSRNMSLNFYLHVLCKNGSQSTFTLDGSATLVPASAFTVVPGTSGLYYGAQISLPPVSTFPIGSHTVSNSTDDFALGVFEGSNSFGGLYHYMSSFLKPVSVSATTVVPLCVSSNNTISLNGMVSGAAATGTWTTNGTGTFGVYTSTLTNVSTDYTLSNADTLLPSIKFYLTSSGSCIPKKDSIEVQIIQRPQLLTGTGATLCANTNSIALTGTVTNATGANWSGGTGSIPSGINISYTPTAADVAAGTLTMTLTSVGGCINVAKNITFTFVPLPTVTAITTNSLICNGQNVTLTAGGANTYSWSTTSTNTSIIVSPSVTTVYTVTGTTNGCSKSATVTQNVSPCTGIEKNGQNDFLTIYPNPNNGEFTISSEVDLKLVLINELGQIIKNIVLNNSNNRNMSVTHLANGVYFITGKNNDRTINQKIIVTK